MNLSFKEKSTWVSLIIMLVVWGYYFNELRAVLDDGFVGRLQTTILFIIALVILVVLNIAGHIVIAITNPRDANQPEDERDRVVSQRAGNIAGIVLGIACINLAAWAMFLDLSSVLMAHCLLLALIIAQIVHDALRLYYYRRGL